MEARQARHEERGETDGMRSWAEISNRENKRRGARWAN